MPASIITPTPLLAQNLPLDGAIAIELQDGIMIFRASHHLQKRIESLLDKQEAVPLTEVETQELDSYAEIDDYLSFVNRMIRNNCILETNLKTPLAIDQVCNMSPAAQLEIVYTKIRSIE